MFGLLLSLFVGCSGTPEECEEVSTKEDDGLYVLVGGDFENTDLESGIIKRELSITRTKKGWGEDEGGKFLVVFISKAKCLSYHYKGHCLPLKDVLELQRLEGDLYE